MMMITMQTDLSQLTGNEQSVVVALNLFAVLPCGTVAKPEPEPMLKHTLHYRTRQFSFEKVRLRWFGHIEHNNNNNNNHDDIYSAVIMTRSLREFTRFIW